MSGHWYTWFEGRVHLKSLLPHLVYKLGQHLSIAHMVFSCAGLQIVTRRHHVSSGQLYLCDIRPATGKPKFYFVSWRIYMITEGCKRVYLNLLCVDL